ncbi:MAG TPA: DUF4436 family protein [Microbacterium sp.]|nr:DUF4436 family protein [Microbacterium sp.]
MTTAPTADRPPHRRNWVWVVALVAAFALIYAVVIALYAANDRLATIRGCTGEPPDDAVLLSFTPEAVDAAGDRLNVNLSVLSFGPAGDTDTGLLADPLTVVVTDTDGARSFTVAAGELPSQQSIRLITEGYIERWPFDSHAVDVAFVSLQEIDGELTPLSTLVCGSAHVPGWTFASAEVPGTDELVIDGEPVQQLRVIATRSVATVAFGIVILGLMAVLPVLALTVAIAVHRGVRKAEPSLMSWMAALLFATIPLRTFLPGSPPIGSWVDYLVVLWVVAGLVVALVVYVRAWLRWGSPGPRADPAG